MSKIREFQKRFQTEKHTGFGAAATTQGDRLLNKDGTYNVDRRGLNIFQSISPFHHLIKISWSKFNFLLLLLFTVLNLIFTLAYYCIGLDELQGLIHTSPFGKFIEVFTFSAQTLTTVGYGRINPVGYAASIISSLEALSGLVSFAFVTGLLYGRFSRPHAKLIYSTNAIIAPFQEGTSLMFRIANSRSNQLAECEATALFSYHDNETKSLRFIPLELEYNKITALALSWTINHPINDKSPLYGLSENEVLELGAEVIFLFKAFDDTYSQQVYTRYSYKATEWVWGAKFVPMYKRSEDGGSTILEINKVGEFIKADLPKNESQG